MTSEKIHTWRGRPLRVMFMTTSMPVGGAETLLVNLIRGLDRSRFSPEVCCLKSPGPLGELLKSEVPVASNLLGHKLDPRVLPRLIRLLRRREIDALVTVGAGDKMFWGRLAAWRAGAPVVACALHSTGWPDSVGWLNRRLTPLTDAFIGVAAAHGAHLVDQIGFPREKVHVIPNGVDIDRFAPLPCRERLKREIGVPESAPTIGILAALRPEKNHELFLQSAKQVLNKAPESHFVVIGDGAERQRLERLSAELGIRRRVRFLGSRDDVPELLSALDVVVLSSHNEAFPVSILEAMAAAKPVVATRVGSVEEAVVDSRTGYLTPPGDSEALAARVVELIHHPLRAAEMGAAARQRVCQKWSLEKMVTGYENLLANLYSAKVQSADWLRTPESAVA